jgi:hypothetical protein
MNVKRGIDDWCIEVHESTKLEESVTKHVDICLKYVGEIDQHV